MKGWVLVYWLISVGPSGEFVQEKQHEFPFPSYEECHAALVRAQPGKDYMIGCFRDGLQDQFQIKVQ